MMEKNIMLAMVAFYVLLLFCLAWNQPACSDAGPSKQNETEAVLTAPCEPIVISKCSSNTGSNSIKVPENVVPTNLFVIRSPIEPYYFLVNTKYEFPHVDGDSAQEYVIDSLNLKSKCKKDPSTVVVDIGGFLGDFGLRAAAFGCKVYIFEPTPLQYWLIKASVELNGFGDRVKVYNYAVSDTSKMSAFKNQGGKTEEITDIKKIDPLDTSVFFVESVTLDSIIPTGNVYLLKVDVEGFEPTVIFGGCFELISQKRVNHIIAEYTAFWAEGGKGPWTTFLDKMMYYGTENTTIFALHRNMGYVYGPLERTMFNVFHNSHVNSKLQTDVYIDVFGENLVSPIAQWTQSAFA